MFPTCISNLSRYFQTKEITDITLETESSQIIHASRSLNVVLVA